MEAIKEVEGLVFDEELIRAGGFIRAKSRSWMEWKNGLVTGLSGDKIRVLFLTGVGCGVGYYEVRAWEVGAGYWELKYSADLAEVIKIAADT